jgi:hypothetical protein
MEVLSLHFPAGTKEKYEILQSGQSVSRPRFKTKSSGAAFLKLF